MVNFYEIHDPNNSHWTQIFPCQQNDPESIFAVPSEEFRKTKSTSSIFWGVLQELEKFYLPSGEIWCFRYKQVQNQQAGCQEICASSTNRGSYQLRPWGFFKILRIPKVIIPCLGMKPPDSIVLRHETPKFPILKLVGGGQPTPLNNMKVSWEYYSQYME
jgi:hypothetical protein